MRMPQNRPPVGRSRWVWPLRDYVVCFQSRFGRTELGESAIFCPQHALWLDTGQLRELGRQKVGKLDDLPRLCLPIAAETLEEIAAEGAETFF